MLIWVCTSLEKKTEFGKEDCDPAHSYGPAIRNHYLFHYILNGKGTLMWQDGKRHENKTVLRAGQGFLISPGQITTYIADDRIPWEYCWLEFDGLRAKEALEITGLSVNHPSTILSTGSLRPSCEMKCSTLFATKKRRRSI